MSESIRVVGDGVYMVIHGHFYQPPRENPWLEAIEREHGAEPFSNWNLRIADECYRSNGFARVFDDRGRVLDIVNNYRHLSFNFGPTLMSWLEVQAPDIYRRILEADRLSIAERSGHGNAIAQAYGHAILPLCNARDRLTQIRWGRRDFSYRFGREPEALWLPETAIDRNTLEDLIAERFSYVILAPKQAARVRRFGGHEWTDVMHDKVDPRMPYRCFSERLPDRYIDVFFYDGPVAHGISFENVLHSSKGLVDKYWGAVDHGRRGAQLVHAAVDGETFGHHMRHAERALSWAFTHEARQRGLRLTNYGEYLERHPPSHEVVLNFGFGGEGTAWSCAHGVGRWCRDCSCHAGGPDGWNQKWRDPLRRAVNLVRDKAAGFFEEAGAELLKDPWAARDAYVELLLDTRIDTREAYLRQHGRDSAGGSRQVRVLKLLEMQRYSLLAQTSCGWFFNDISGLEAVQVLKYAARTVQLYEEISGRDGERGLLEVLGEARSNVPEHGSGADVYRKLVLPALIGRHRLVAQYAITDAFRDYPDDHRFFAYQIRRVEKRRLTNGPVAVSVGRLQVEFLRTGENADINYALIHFGGHDFHCAVRSSVDIQRFRSFAEELERIFHRATITELLRFVDQHFGEAYYGLVHLLAEERADVLAALFGHLTERFSEAYERLYTDNRRSVIALADTGLKIPPEFRMAAEYVLSRQLNELVREQRGSKDPTRYLAARQIVEEAWLRGYELDLGETEEIFSSMITRSVELLASHPNAAAIHGTRELLGLARSLRANLKLDSAQNLLFVSLTTSADEVRGAWRACRSEAAMLLEDLGLSPCLADR